ncbi:hypothetical protein AAG570_003716 [Ranatra chinensis]|uniref:Acyltransferase n=1 Tax=Ranatra chinensis TaxID=642074 RepID=A0ABD0Y4F7_9HEMI
MGLLGIKWAPLNVPWHRRLETAMALFWIISLALGGPFGVALLVYLIFFSNYYLVGLLYIAWMYYDRNTCYTGGRRCKFIRRLFIWKYFVNFFPMRLERSEELSPNENYMFCVFPHGLLSAGAFAHFGTEVTQFGELFPGLTVFNATLDMHFKTPFFREYLMSLGVVSASKESLLYLLDGAKKGNVLILVVGGAAESLYAHPGTYRIVLKNRKGFVRIALKTGTPLVPVFSFGETDLYDQVQNPPGSTLLRFQNWLRKYTGLAPCLFIGRGILQYSFGLLPMRAPVTTVVGKPIAVPKIANPSQEEVEKYHHRFTEDLVKLFEENKGKYIKNPEATELIIE